MYDKVTEFETLYDKVTEFETLTLQILSRPYNQGTYCGGAGMARRPLTV